jgi:hypothetical protein
VRRTHDRRLGFLDRHGRGHRGSEGLTGRGRDRGDDRLCRLGFGRRRSGLRLYDDGLALQPARVGQPANAIGRRLVDARRVALHPDLELVGKLDHDGVVNAELSCQLVNPDLLRRQNSPFP